MECLACGKPTKGILKTCNRECRRIVTERRSIAICENAACAKKFKRKPAGKTTRRFCSTQCANEGQKAATAESRTRNCIVCANPFVGTRKSARFCSSKCLGKHMAITRRTLQICKVCRTIGYWPLDNATCGDAECVRELNVRGQVSKNWRIVFCGFASREHRPSAWRRKDMKAKFDVMASTNRHRCKTKAKQVNAQTNRPASDKFRSLAKAFNKQMSMTNEERTRAEWKRKFNNMASNQRKRLRRRRSSLCMINSADDVTTLEMN